MKKIILLSAVALALVVAVPAHAQIGGTTCNDSPENPTLILAGLAGGAYTVSQMRIRLRARRAMKKQAG